MTSSLQKGIDAAKSGLMEEALAHLKDAIVEEPQNADVWVWLSAIIEDEEKQTIFLKKALEIDPENRPARRGLAFIERKKYIPPKPGEKLSDYTRPIGIFKTPDTVTPAQAAANVSAAAQAEEANRVGNSAPASPASDSATPDQVSAPASLVPNKRKPALDILLYGLTLMVFIIIGILVGTTLLNADLAFLAKPTPVLSVLPQSEGVFVLNKDQLAEMKLHLNVPTDSEGIPQITQKRPEVVINTQLITSERLRFLDEAGNDIAFLLKPAESNINILTPQSELTPGRYCMVYTLNAEKQEALYWCFITN